ncbi:MAG: hypothetical protein IJU92_08110 [Spirochaetaceae bacterium]|nr:hypothetical protein [Spirochaetaceae bacterium]
MFAATSGNYRLPASYAKAESYRTNTPYPEAQNIIADSNLDSLRRYNPTEYITAVAKWIKNFSSNQFARAKLAHDVTALLLFYDDVSYWSDNLPSQDVATCLRTRRSVCSSYANVFKALCDAVGLECEKVSGYARGVGYSHSTYEKPNDSNHAWNIVQLDGAWYLVDCTWDSGHMDGRTSVQDYSTTWLFAKPEFFLCTHFPTDDATQQLLPRQVTASGFTKLPYLRPNLADAVELFTYPQKENYVENFLLLSYKCKNGYTLSINVKDNSDNYMYHCTMSQEIQGKTQTLVAFPNIGHYKISLFAKKDRSSIWCGEFQVTNMSSGINLNAMTSEQIHTAMLDKNNYQLSSTLIDKGDTYIAKAPQNNNTQNANTFLNNISRQADNMFFGLSVSLPFGEILNRQSSLEKMSYAFELLTTTNKNAFVYGFEYTHNDYDATSTLHSGMVLFNYGRIVFEKFAPYIGAGLGLRFDKDSSMLLPKSKPGLLNLTYIAFKAEVGAMVIFTNFYGKINISYSNALGFSVGFGIGVGGKSH